MVNNSAQPQQRKAMSKKQLAQAIGIHPGTLRRWFDRDQIWKRMDMEEKTFKKRQTLSPFEASQVIRYYTEGS